MKSNLQNDSAQVLHVRKAIRSWDCRVTSCFRLLPDSSILTTKGMLCFWKEAGMLILKLEVMYNTVQLFFNLVIHEPAKNQSLVRTRIFRPYVKLQGFIVPLWNIQRDYVWSWLASAIEKMPQLFIAGSLERKIGQNWRNWVRVDKWPNWAENLGKGFECFPIWKFLEAKNTQLSTAYNY